MTRRSRVSMLGCALAAVAAAQQAAPRRLDTTTFVVLGEGLAAGMSDFGLRDTAQVNSFPAQVARQIGTILPQPLIQGPGIADVLGQQQLPVILPSLPQNQVRAFPRQPNPANDAPTLFVLNLSVPNFRIADSLASRPVPPLIHDRSMKQSSINLILGFPSLIFNQDVPLWTQTEYAVAMAPTMALVELGYFDVLEAAVAGDPTRIPTPAAVRQSLSQIVSRLRAQQVEVVLANIPDPMDTAYFTPLSRAAGTVLATPLYVLTLGYNLPADALLSRNGVYAIGTDLFRRELRARLPEGSVLSAAAGRDITARVRAINAEIANLARESNAVLFDLAALFSRVKASGVRAGNRTLTADYLGGFYSLDGYYPGATGHAVIANEMITLLNRTYNRSYPLVDLAAISRQDTTLDHRIYTGPLIRPSELGLPEEPEAQSIQ